MGIKKFVSFYYRSLIVFLLIFIASTISGKEVQKVNWILIPNFDKLVHLGMYFCFSFVLIYDLFKAKPDFSSLKIFLISVLSALAYGGFLEVLQGTLTKTRTADILDFLFDTIGGVLAVVFWKVFKKPK
jgi:VanZ family protein